MHGQKDEEESELSDMLHAWFERNGAKRQLFSKWRLLQRWKGEGEMWVCFFAKQLCSECQGFKEHRGAVWSIIFCPAFC